MEVLINMKRINKIIVAVLAIVLVIGVIPAVTGSSCNNVFTITINTPPAGVIDFVVLDGVTPIESGDQVERDTVLTVSWLAAEDANARLFINGTQAATVAPHSHTVVANTTFEIRGGTIDPNTPFVIGVSQPEAVFSPFFSSTGVDNQITSMTQLSLLSADRYGQLAFGEGIAAAAADVSVRVIGEGVNRETVYQFVLKPDLYFSDGEPLTMRDVLFSFYTLLDPAYTGMSTMSSVDIVGLRSYRLNNPGAVTQAQEDALRAVWREAAVARRGDIYHYLTTPGSVPRTANVLADLNHLIYELGRDLISTWGAAQGGVQGLRDQYFPAEYDWEVFLFSLGMLSIHITADGPLRDPHPTNPNMPGFFRWSPQEHADWVRNFAEITNPDGSIDMYDAVQLIFESLVPGGTFNSDPEYTWTYISQTQNATTGHIRPTGLASVLIGWPAGNNLLTELTTRAMTAHFDEIIANTPGGQRLVPTIEGITAITGADFVPSEISHNGAGRFTADYEMLQIRIHGVDPRAIWSFGPAIAPMHHYSREAEIVLARAQPISPTMTAFGVSTGDADFMRHIQSRNRLPLGAGPFRMATGPGFAADDYANGFWRDNIAYMQRNEHFLMGAPHIRYLRFQTVNQANVMNMLANGTIHFADPSATVANQAVVAGESHLSSDLVWTNGYGYIGISAYHIPEIGIRRAIMAAINVAYVEDYFPGELSLPLHRGMSFESWIHRDYDNDGNFIGEWAAGTESFYYGRTNAYRAAVSANNNIARQAAVLAVVNAHLTGGVQYPVPAGHPNPGLFTADTAVPSIHRGVDGVTWVTPERPNGLSFTFNVAGNSPDHPAWMMLFRAAELLNSDGWDITVRPNNQVLRYLGAGQGLEVWAAAWGSTIDPCLFQIWHRHSTAPSVNNWGYRAILDASSGRGGVPARHRVLEQSLVTSISHSIDQSRAVLDQASRTLHIRQALNTIMELAVELPTYNRRDLFVYNTELLDTSTMQTGAQLTSHWGPLSRVWEIRFN